MGSPRRTRILHNYITLLILIISQGQQNDVALVDPDLLPQFSTDMREAARAVETLGFETAVTKHLHDLGVFLAFLFEDEFALFVVVFVLAPTSVLAALLCVSMCWVEEGLSGRASCVLCDCDCVDGSDVVLCRASSRREA
jgi:hypothetical protein